MEPQSEFPHMNMRLSPSQGMEHKHLCGMELGTYGSYNEASYHKSQNKVDSPHYSSDAYKHVAHSPALLGTSFHKSNLDSKEPVSLSSHTCMTLSQLSCKWQCKGRDDIFLDIGEIHKLTIYHKFPHTVEQQHHKPSLHTLSSHKGKSSSPGMDNPHTHPHDTLWNIHAFHNRATFHTDYHT